MILSIEEMRLLQAARNEERLDRSRLFLASQSIFDAISKDVFIGKADLGIGGGDPIIWGACARASARSGKASTIALLTPVAFQGTPLAALHDDEFRRHFPATYLPQPDKLDDWLRTCAAEFAEAGGRILKVADQVRIFNKSKGDLFGVVDRDDERPRMKSRQKRSDHGVRIEHVSRPARAAAFTEESERLYRKSISIFEDAFQCVSRGFPEGRRYGDVLRLKKLFLATDSEAHVKVLAGKKNSQIIRANFSISRSASISNAVWSWRDDLELVRTGGLWTE